MFTPIPIEICYGLLSDAFDETNSFGVTLSVPSLLCGLLHDVFQYVSVHPIPIDFCYGLLSDALHETNSFGVTLSMPSLLCGLLHDVFQDVSVHPIPIEICYGLLSDAKDTNTFSLCVCVQPVSPSRQCNYALPSHPTLLFSFRAQRASETLLYETNSFGVTFLVPSLPCGLLHDVFQYVSVHPQPH